MISGRGSGYYSINPTAAQFEARLLKPIAGGFGLTQNQPASFLFYLLSDMGKHEFDEHSSSSNLGVCNRMNAWSYEGLFCFVFRAWRR